MSTLIEQHATPPRSQSRAKWIVGVALIVSGVGGLAAWSMTSPGAVSYFTTPSEVAADTAAARTKSLRLGGRVAEGSLVRDGATVRFDVTDGHAVVGVTYSGEIPDTLHEGTDVVAEGRLDTSGTLQATRVLAKCSSRFVPAVEQQARDAASG